MNSDHIFSKFIQNLNVRAQYVGCKMDGGVSSEYGFGYMQSLLYHMLREVPGVDVYVESHIDHLMELNQMEFGDFKPLVDQE